ncbi:uncharacterized protein BO97DRAFT_237546 [Aspergillus homomorphus CBS 101889]|uniref:Uncharacterized protein n=1 Tax=Aspergillus homomorphus (strain CBS 101889) TaxID=1450537 RepID=A0A395I7L2_ASPHC|nr:hypothetical protein BO97DRAFT_237546 [Aspergillus homomorphus CBS 101889]RAL15058.1 hypothetical protein BO97DRAFT_237546 [Aspergillus homomorphus CBS 101889]
MGLLRDPIFNHLMCFLRRMFHVRIVHSELLWITNIIGQHPLGIGRLWEGPAFWCAGFGHCWFVRIVSDRLYLTTMMSRISYDENFGLHCCGSAVSFFFVFFFSLPRLFPSTFSLVLSTLSILASPGRFGRLRSFPGVHVCASFPSDMYGHLKNLWASRLECGVHSGWV